MVFRNIILLNPLHQAWESEREVLLSLQESKAETLSPLAKVTQPVSDRAWTYTRIFELHWFLTELELVPSTGSFYFLALTLDHSKNAWYWRDWVISEVVLWHLFKKKKNPQVKAICANKCVNCLQNLRILSSVHCYAIGQTLVLCLAWISVFQERCTEM